MSAARTFVIGDIHGCSDELDRLLEVLSPGSADTVCFLGDYIDRGPSPRRVIERLIRLQAEGPACIFLRGNHEDMFLAYLGLDGAYGQAFLWNGGGATLASYLIDEHAGVATGRLLPPSHLEFLVGLRTYARLGHFFCVHAGVRPSRPLSEQREEDMLWIREEFIDREHPFDCTVLYGHTPHRDVRLHLPYKIGLDTGVVYGNRLSCLELGIKELFQISRGAREVQRRSLAGAFDQQPQHLA